MKMQIKNLALLAGLLWLSAARVRTRSVFGLTVALLALARSGSV